jgi:hypothetical protein
MTAAATVLLGLAEMSPIVGVALALTALTALVNGLDSFFNFRSRWVIMEEGQAEFHRLDSDLDFAERSGDLDDSVLRRSHESYQQIWRSMSAQWIESRHQVSGGP